jgi:hypothetical protein
MCEKCREIDKNIERYRRMLLAIGDQLTIDRTKEMIGDLEAQKVALHPAEARLLRGRGLNCLTIITVRFRHRDTRNRLIADSVVPKAALCRWHAAIE